MFEKCGVVGIHSQKDVNAVPMIMTCLKSLQHRGQESWGIAVPNFRPFRRRGIVSLQDQESIQEIRKLTGNTGVGHVRYTTTGKSTIEKAHPLKIGKKKKFYLCHNGTLDRNLLISHLKKWSIPDKSLTDSELLGIGLHHNLKRGSNWIEAFHRLNSALNGSFSVVILTDKGELIAARDKKGFRPLCLGWHNETKSHIIVSESVALDRIGAKLIRDVRPGEIIIINNNGLIQNMFTETESYAYCAFEYIYFAHPSSYINGSNVYVSRKKLGRYLAKKYPVDGEVVIPVPDSARPAALGYSEKSGIPFEEGLMKDRYRGKGSWRSFIEPNKREQIISNIIQVKPVINGKKVILIDDSIVRGTSSKLIIKDQLRDAKEVSLFLTFPPITYPCFMGIDFPTQEELLAYRVCGNNANIEEVNTKIAKEIGVKNLGYNDLEGLIKGIGIPKENLCKSCVTGDYSCLEVWPKFRSNKEIRC